MKASKQEVIINHPAKSIYEIVLDIEKYPEFIPWCSAVKIRARKINSIKAELFVKYKVFQKTFTSNVVYDSNKLNLLSIAIIFLKPCSSLIFKLFW